MALVEVSALNFEYPGNQVLKNISFEIAAGSVTALVGPNGAGKTTLLRCLTSLETPLSGSVVINRLDVHENPRQAHQFMGYLSDFFGLYDDLSVRQCLSYMAWCHKLPPHNLQVRIEALAAEVDISPYLDAKAGTLSRGYRQRLGVGLALVHDPGLLILDEPASGMDPEARIGFSRLVNGLRNRGMTIIVSSHILAELEEYCTDMLVIRDGEIKSHVILQQHHSEQETIIQIGINDVAAKYVQIIQQQEGAGEITVFENQLAVAFSGGKSRQAALLAFLISRKIPVNSFSPAPKTLKAAYMDLAGKKAGPA